MKWVKCLCSEISTFAFSGSGYKDITTGKIYKVVEYVKGRPFIRIINDIGEERGVFLNDFEDVTAEVIANERDNKLNDLGI